jgi:hypothetical protein
MRLVRPRLVGSLALTFASLLPVTAMAQQTSQPAPPAPPPNQINSARTQTDQRGLIEFWTPERMRAAQPTPLPRVDPTPPRN